MSGGLPVAPPSEPSGSLLPNPQRPEKKYNDTDGIAAYVGHSGDETLKFMSCLTDWILPEKRATTTGRIDTNFDHRAPRPELGGGQLAKCGSGTVTTDSEGAVPHYTSAFNLAFNTQLDFFGWLELPENEHRLARFGHAMTGTRQFETKGQILRGASPGLLAHRMRDPTY